MKILHSLTPVFCRLPRFLRGARSRCFFSARGCCSRNRARQIPPTNDLESALVATLAPGNYTAIVRGKNNTTGVGLVEAYNLQ
jgi:hypothetical protein